MAYINTIFIFLSGKKGFLFLQNGAFQFGIYHFEISSTGRTDNKVVLWKQSVRDYDLSDMLGKNERSQVPRQPVRSTFIYVLSISACSALWDVGSYQTLMN